MYALGNFIVEGFNILSFLGRKNFSRQLPNFEIKIRKKNWQIIQKYGQSLEKSEISQDTEGGSGILERIAAWMWTCIFTIIYVFKIISKNETLRITRKALVFLLALCICVRVNFIAKFINSRHLKKKKHEQKIQYGACPFIV